MRTMLSEQNLTTLGRPRHGSKEFTLDSEHTEPRYYPTMLFFYNICHYVNTSNLESSNLWSGLVHSQEPSVTKILGMSIKAPKRQQHDDEGLLRKNTNNNSNGNCVGGSHKLETNTTWEIMGKWQRWDISWENDKDEMRCFLSNHNTHHQAVCFF